MPNPSLYRGLWPQNVSKLAKYAVRFVDGEWRITVLYDAGAGLRYLAVEGGGGRLAEQINVVKQALSEQPGGAFYVNEFRHVIVPVAGDAASGAKSLYYFCARLEGDFTFDFEGAKLSTKPITPTGQSLKPGDRWLGPRPGIPYVLAAGGTDIYFDTPAMTESDPPKVRAGTTRRTKLSDVLRDKAAVTAATRPIASLRGHQGGRFYVNEHGAIFTPVGAADGNGLDYVFAGVVDRTTWFPEPTV